MVQAQITEILDVYEALPTWRLISAARALTLPDLPEQSRRRVDIQALNGSIAFAKVDYYKQFVEEMNDARKYIGVAMMEFRAFSGRSNSMTMPLDDQLFHLSGKQEVYIHYLANATERIRQLLNIARRGVGLKEIDETKSLLRPFALLRDHMEHLEDRLPGNSQSASFPAHIAEEDRILWGFDTVGEDKILLEGVEVPASDDGVKMILAEIARNEGEIRKKAMAMVSRAAVATPDRIPPLDRVGHSVKSGAGRLPIEHKRTDIKF